MRKVLYLAAGTLLAGSMAYGAEQGTANGTITVGGHKTQLKYAVAKTTTNGFDKKKTDVVVLLSNIPVSAEAFNSIGDMFKLADNGLVGVEVEITPEKSIISGQMYSPDFKLQGNSFSAVGMHEFKPTTFTTKQVAGKLASTHESTFNHVAFSYAATFDVAVGQPKAAAAPALKGTPLPPGGGDVGKTYMTYTKTVAGGDMAGVQKAVSAERAKQMKDDPDFKQMFPLIQAMQPKNIKITGGAVNGDTATLTATGSSDGDPATGTITMVREGGAWKVQKENWSSKH